MNKIVESIRKSANWGGRVLSLGVALALLLSLVMPLASIATVSTPTSRIQPLLLQMAAQQPDQVVSVIVQKTAKDNRVEKAVSTFGGQVTKDLSIINAFAAEMKAKDVARLVKADGVRWVSLDAPVTQSQTADTHIFTTWATAYTNSMWGSFTNAPAIVDSMLGPNGTYGSANSQIGSFAGFAAEVTPGHAITKVEVVLRAYAAGPLWDTDRSKLSVLMGGKRSSNVTLSGRFYDPYIGAANVATLYVDITSLRAWQWSDFDTLELVVDQYDFDKIHKIYHDAIGLRVTSAPGIDLTGGLAPTYLPKAAVDISKLLNVFNKAVRATNVWNESPAYLQGQGVTVAVVDSGIFKIKDIDKRLIGKVNFNPAFHDAADRFGHGTFVASIIAGDGKGSAGQYLGIAPKTNVLNVRISDDQGMSTESDVVDALQWIYTNKAKYNIRVVNLSLNTSVAQSHQTSPLDAACEILWFNGIVVVVSAGNNGTASLYPPANDPFLITVGATDDKNTVSLSDDAVASFSAYGTDETGGAKPDLVAPGRNVIAPLPENDKLTISRDRPANRVNTRYFRMSGTSVSAPMVSGAVALLLQDEPNLNPDQVKYRLKATANKSWPGYSPTQAGAGILDIYAAIHGTTTDTANTGTPVSNLLTSGPDGVLGPTVQWSSVQWSSVQWSSVQWSSVQWSSVQWSSVQWSSDYWEP